MEERYRVTNIDGTETYTGFKGFAKGEALRIWSLLPFSKKRDVAEGKYRITITQVDESDEEILGGYSVDMYDVLLEEGEYLYLLQHFEYRFFTDVIHENHGMFKHGVFGELEKKGYLRDYADKYEEVAKWLEDCDSKIFRVEIPLQGYYVIEVEADSVEEAIDKAHEAMETSSMDSFVEVNESGFVWVNGEAIE